MTTFISIPKSIAPTLVDRLVHLNPDHIQSVEVVPLDGRYDAAENDPVWVTGVFIAGKTVVLAGPETRPSAIARLAEFVTYVNSHG